MENVDTNSAFLCVCAAVCVSQNEEEKERERETHCNRLDNENRLWVKRRETTSGGMAGRLRKPDAGWRERAGDWGGYVIDLEGGKREGTI